MSTWEAFHMTIAILAVVLGVFNIYWQYKNEQRIKKKVLDRESKANGSGLSDETLEFVRKTMTGEAE